MTEYQKAKIVRQFLAAQSEERTKQSFYSGVKFPNNIDSDGRRMYPIFYIPPYNDGKKLKTIYNQTPKTHILSANMYELEIIRLLFQIAPDEPTVQNMVIQTLERLKTTCFGYYDDGLGECFDTSLIVLRFLAATSDDTAWMQSRIDNYNNHVSEKKRPWYPLWYFWLCLSELPFEIARPEILKYEDDMLPWLTTKSAVMNSEHDKTVHPVLLCSLRNCLCRFPECAHIKDIQPYVSEKDGRLHFDMNAKMEE
ncbi:MAG TPA: hypothetical protein VJY54_01835 [Lachnospiraceae bacterium]|nr:hypothetical protein [Lachnospiraceae bacterium]